MPGLIPSELVTGLFDSLNAAGVNYLNIKNISHELPDHLEDGKDIDILVSPSDEQKFCETMAANGYVAITYPYGPANGLGSRVQPAGEQALSQTGDNTDFSR